MRSLPDVQSALVRSEGTPNLEAWSASSWLSVQSTMVCAIVACRQRSSTWSSIGLPPISATNLRGRRLEFNRAGMARITVKAWFIGSFELGWESMVNQGLLVENTTTLRRWRRQYMGAWIFRACPLQNADSFHGVLTGQTWPDTSCWVLPKAHRAGGSGCRLRVLWPRHHGFACSWFHSSLIS